MLKLCTRISVAIAVALLVSASSAGAQNNSNHRTKMTFSQAVEVPGKVLPAGTYTFELDDSDMNRHIIQIYDEKGTRHIHTVLAVPDYRLKRTSETVVHFAEVAPGQPQAVRAWFFPGMTVGDELIYSKKRAHELATATNVVVPATDVDNAMSKDVVAVTPKQEELPVTTIQTTPTTPPPQAPPQQMAPPPPTPQPATPETRNELPHTASPLPTVALFGLSLIAAGLTLRRFTLPRA